MGRMENDIIDGSFRGWDLRKSVGVILFHFIILSLFHIHFLYSITRLCGSVEMFNLVYIWSRVLTYSLVCHVVTHELSFLITVIYSSSRPPQHYAWLCMSESGPYRCGLTLATFCQGSTNCTVLELPLFFVKLL